MHVDMSSSKRDFLFSPGVEMAIGLDGNLLSIPPKGATIWLVPCKLEKAIQTKFFFAASLV